MDEEVVEVLKRQPCVDCGSSDAMSVYSDGHSYCFSCQTHHNHTNSEVTQPVTKVKKGVNLITINEMYSEPLRARGITKATCQKYGYYLSKRNTKPIQVACYYNKDNEMIGQKIRYADKTFETLGHISETFFGQHLWNNGKKLVITEGEIDCLTVSQLNGNKYPVVSIPQGCQSAKKVFNANMEWLSGFEEVIVMFDMDKPGRKATEEVCGILPPGVLKIATLPMKDANECLLAGIADKVLAAIWQATVYRPDGIVNGSELLDTLMDESKESIGYTLPWDIPMQEMLQGVRKGELVLITAGTGIGKTTFVRKITHHFGCTLGLKCGLMMLEEPITRTAQGLMAIHSGKRLALNRHIISDEEYKKVFEETLGTGNFVFYQHFGSLESNNLLSKMRYLAVAEKCDFIILDHITIAISGLDIDNERKATDVLMTNLRSLAEETGVGLLIISHLKRVEGKPAEEGGAISLSHLRGSQALAQLSDAVIALERDQQAEDGEKNLVKLRVLKNRFTGETGIGGYLRYNKETDDLEKAEASTKAAPIEIEGMGEF